MQKQTKKHKENIQKSAVKPLFMWNYKKTQKDRKII